MRPQYSGPLFMLEGGAPWSGGGRTWPGPTANYLRPPRGSSTHGPTTRVYEIGVVRAVANARTLVGDAPETMGARIWE